MGTHQMYHAAVVVLQFDVRRACKKTNSNIRGKGKAIIQISLHRNTYCTGKIQCFSSKQQSVCTTIILNGTFDPVSDPNTKKKALVLTLKELRTEQIFILGFRMKMTMICLSKANRQEDIFYFSQRPFTDFDPFLSIEYSELYPTSFLINKAINMIMAQNNYALN